MGGIFRSICAFPCLDTVFTERPRVKEQRLGIHHMRNAEMQRVPPEHLFLLNDQVVRGFDALCPFPVEN